MSRPATDRSGAGNLFQARPLAPVVAALRTGERDPATEATGLCDRIDEIDTELRAFVPESGRRARLAQEAASVAARWPDAVTRPPMYGVPVGIKDIVRVDGLPTRAGSALPPEVLAGEQAPVVDRLREAGALVAGKTATAEFAASAPGPTGNPHHLGHTPGGSSSGSAAAVAAGMVPLAIGTQTVGSVIRPAAYCGVVGFKPSHGRIPAAGVIANAPTLDTVGVFAADVAGVAIAARVLCDEWQDFESPPIGPPVLGIPAGPYLERAGGPAIAAYRQQVRTLRAAGFTVRTVPVMDDFDTIAERLYTVNRYELARVHADWFARFGERYREQTRAAIRQGLGIGQRDYAHALRARESFRQHIAAVMSDAGIDLWIAPSATGAAPSGLGSTGDPVMSLPWSFAGLPSVSVPAGRVDGLPLGLQCVGLPGADEPTLRWATTVEAAVAA